ncbi:MAG: hypothetical protein EA390_04590 [Balneolaceae bacterium]|nr:MAG: hypothetical protein EA390_04590 [Balneolaceae bacterium]
MERIVRQITEKLLQKLPTHREFYTPDDLHVLDIPEFITERLVLEMNQNLNDSLNPPDTEWASMDKDAVQFAWRNFIEAIKAEVRMPHTYAPSLFETAIADTLELAIQPRKAIPDTLFGVDEILTIEVIKKRIKYITVGRKLAAALARYMEKKSKSSLTLEQCREIVEKVDDKLIAGYNSLDWAKEVEAIFLMAGPDVDTDLFRIYFEDKRKPKLARKFDKINTPVNRTNFIEVLSTPDFSETEEKPEIKPAAKKPAEPETVPVKSGLKTDKADKPEKKKDSLTPDDTILGSFQRKRVSSWEDEDEPAEEEERAEEPIDDDWKKEPLHERFVFDESEAENLEPSNEKTAETDRTDIDRSITNEPEPDYKVREEGVEEQESFSKKELDFDLLNKWRKIGGISEEEEDLVLSETEKPDDSDDEQVASIELYNETDEEEEVPMWRAFLEREDLSDLKEDEQGSDRGDTGYYGEEFDEEEYKAAFEASEMATRIDQWLGKDKQKYVREIFDKSETAYNDAITEITRFDDWKGASKFIRNEIFEKNNVDIFDSVAVDFTDRLHTFFIESKT